MTKKEAGHSSMDHFMMNIYQIIYCIWEIRRNWDRQNKLQQNQGQIAESRSTERIMQNRYTSMIL